MGFWNKLFGKSDEQKVGGMEDFMTLIRVYFQAAMASDLGITNLAALPDLRVFKATLKVPTVNNKLGVGERSRCKKMLKEMYGMEDDFFKEIDQSLRKRCKKIQDAQTYLLQFQGFRRTADPGSHGRCGGGYQLLRRDPPEERRDRKHEPEF